MNHLNIAIDDRFAPLATACAEGRTFNLYMEGSTSFTLTRGADLRGLAGWIEAHANFAEPEAGDHFFRVFETLPDGESFFCAYIISAGKGREGVKIHNDVAFPARFFG